MIEESEIFIKQVLRLKKKYSYIEEDVQSLKLEILRLAFKATYPLNIHIVTIKKEHFLTEVWRIRLINSNNNKGKRGGYRVFYCKNRDNAVLLLGIYPKQDIKNNNYQKIAKELVEISF